MLSSEQDRWTIAEVGVHNQYDSWHIWIHTILHQMIIHIYIKGRICQWLLSCRFSSTFPALNGKSLQASFWPLAQANLCPPAGPSTVFDLSSSCASCRSLWTPLTLPRRGRLNITQRMCKCNDMDEDGERCIVYIVCLYIYAYVHVYYDALF